MTYTDADDLDFSLIERNAYQRGDMVVAQLAAVALDRSQELETTREELEKERDDALELVQSADTVLADLKQDIQDRLEAVDTILANCKRISKRDELEAALQAVYNATT